MEEKFYSVVDVAKILELHPKTVLRFVREGRIKARKIGRSWKVTGEELKAYCHAELAVGAADAAPLPGPSYETLSGRVSASAVVEIAEQGSEEASRVSNSLLAMLNAEKGADGRVRFDFFYYPEIGKARYVFYGSPAFVARVMRSFQALCGE